MKTILIPVFNERISSRLDCSEYFQLIEIDKNIIQSRETIRMASKNQLEKLNCLLSIKPDTIICNGLTDFYKNEFLKNKIKVIPWVHGEIEEILNNFLEEKLLSKTSRNILSKYK